MNRFLATFVLLLAPLTYAQSTKVIATVTDSDGQTWNNGTYNITFVPVPGNPGPYYLDGQPFNSQIYDGFLSNIGFFSLTLPSNDHITPAGTKWSFAISPNASSGTFTIPLSVTGTSVDFSSTISAAAQGPRFPSTPWAHGYLDAEISPIPQTGGQYYNVVSGSIRVRTRSAWESTASAAADEILSNPDATQTITQPINTNFNINTSGTGLSQYNGAEILSRSTGVQLSPSLSQTITIPSPSSLFMVVPGTATGRTDTTPVYNVAMTDNSALNTSGSIQGDSHLTPYMRADITAITPNDVASYENIFCNYTGSSPVTANGNCIPHFFIIGNTAADRHNGIWGGNAIVAEHANTPSFGWEVNTFNYSADGNILANGTYSAGPFFGFAATATSGTGFFLQQAAFVASNNNAGGTGGGWNTGLLVADAAQAAVMCGLPSNAATVAYCNYANALNISTSTNNYGSVPSVEIANTWTGSINGIHSVTTDFAPTANGANPINCKRWKIDGVTEFDICSDGTLHVNSGSNAIYRCSVAGALRAGQLTSVASDCGTAVDTGLRTN